MDPISIGITAGSALFSGISSLIASDNQAELEEQKKKRAQELLGRSIIDTGELDAILATNTRRFNANLQRVLNTSALKGRGLANSNVVGAAAAGEIAGQAAQSEAQLRSGVIEHNKSVFSQMAAVEAATPTRSDPFEEFITGGISGAMAGMEISKGIAGMEKFAGIGTPAMDTVTTNTSPLGNHENIFDYGAEDYVPAWKEQMNRRFRKAA